MKKIQLKYIAAGVLLVASLVDTASAVPSFARQTGLKCEVCHTVFPELTAVGRNFKLHGYTLNDGKKHMIPLAAMLQVDMTHPKNGTAVDDKINFSQASIFYGGKIYGKVGAFAQFTYENGDASTDPAVFGSDLIDVRYADTTKLNGKELVYGISVNNNPSVQDLWNTTGAWISPYAGGLGIGSTLFDPDMAPAYGGITAYGLWNDLVYAEVGVYKGVHGKGLMQFFSWDTVAGDPTAAVGEGTSPYARIAIQHNVGNNYFMLGGFVFQTKVNPHPDASTILDQYKDHVLDAEWQYTNGVHLITATASKVWEKQTLNGSLAAGDTVNLDHTSDTTNAKIGYYYNHMYGASFNYTTSKNSGDYVGNDATGTTVELDYLPVETIRLSLQVNQYTKFGGTSVGASDNNNVYLNAWFMF